MYCVGSTLKMTCRESRDAALRIFRRRGTGTEDPAWVSFGVLLSDDDEDDDDNAHLDADRCFYMHTQLDVICLQFCDYDHADRSNGWASYAPYWGNGFDLPMLKYQQQIAIEYNRSWDYAFADEDAESFLMGLPLEPQDIVPELCGPKWVPFHFPRLKCFYVIDYSITPQRDRPSDSPKQNHASHREVIFANGKTFHAVSPDDDSWMVHSHIRRFVAWLEAEYPSTAATDTSSLSDWGDEPSPAIPGSLQFKVLACVGTEGSLGGE